MESTDVLDGGADGPTTMDAARSSFRTTIRRAHWIDTGGLDELVRPIDAQERAAQLTKRCKDFRRRFAED
jgi:hypothetical protein